MRLQRPSLYYYLFVAGKGCVALSLENIQRSQQLSPLEMVEMFVAVFCFLKDSSEVSQRLLDDFRASQGYAFLVEFLVKLDNDRRSGEGDATACDEIEAATRNLILMIVSLCMCGFVELRPNQSHTSSIFQLQGFQIPQISTRGSSVRNIHAFWVSGKKGLNCFPTIGRTNTCSLYSLFSEHQLITESHPLLVFRLHKNRNYLIAGPPNGVLQVYVQR